MPPPAGSHLDYARPGLKVARNIPVWPALIINLPVMAVIIFAIAQSPGFWLRHRWFREGSVWYSTLAVSVFSVILTMIALYLARWHYSPRRKEWAASVVVVALFNVLLASSIYPPHMHKHYNLTRCWANLHQVFQCLVMYTNEHSGKYPDSLESAVLEFDPSQSQTLTCPNSDDRRISADDREKATPELSQPGHVYFGRNRDRRTTPPGTLIACDKPHNHDRPDYDCLALFADGSIRSIPRVQLERLISQQVAATAPSAIKNTSPIPPIPED